MTTRRDEAKLREVADHHAADDPALAAQLYADADYLAQLHKHRPTSTVGVPDRHRRYPQPPQDAADSWTLPRGDRA